MAINLDKIRQKLEQLKNNQSSGGGNSLLWKPSPGKYVVRTLPWPSVPDGEVYKEVQFYYGILPRGGIVAPKQFGAADPVFELQRKCYDDGSDEMKELAKQLYPRPRAFAPILVRGEEDKGVRIWSFSKTTHEDLLAFYIDEGLMSAPLGIADPYEGYDIDVEITPVPNTTWYKTKLDIPRTRRSSALVKDKAEVEKMLESIPSLEEMYPCPTYDTVKMHLDNWLSTSRADADTDERRPVAAAAASKPRKTAEEVSNDIDDVLSELDDLE